MAHLHDHGHDGAHGHGADHHHHHGHGDAHGHAHGPGGHHHAPADFGWAFKLGIGLNAAFIVVEVVAGYLGHSVALLADAGHNVSDVLGLVAAFVAHQMGRRAPTARFTYGFGSTSILAALFNAVLLLIVVGGLSLEALQRIADPAPVAAGTVMVVAALGVLVNGGTALLFARGRKGDLNLQGAYLHMLADALVSIGVIVAGAIILATGWQWLDPVVSLLVNAAIVAGTWALLRDSLAMSLNAVPPGIEIGEVHGFLAARPGVAMLHDLHVWPMSTTETALTAHVVMPGGHPGDAFLAETADHLRERFGIGHATVQIETSPDSDCTLRWGHGSRRQLEETE